MEKHNGTDHELVDIEQQGHGSPGGRLVLPTDAEDVTDLPEESLSDGRNDQSILEVIHDEDKPKRPQGLGNYFVCQAPTCTGAHADLKTSAYSHSATVLILLSISSVLPLLSALELLSH